MNSIKIHSKVHLILALSMLIAPACGDGAWYEMPSKSVSSISLDSQECSIRVGETWPLRVSFSPAGSSSVIQWQSSSESIATISSIGTITGVGVGTATITAISARNDEATAVCTVTVLPAPEPDVLVQSIKFDQTTFELNVGEYVNLAQYVNVLPAKATNPSLIWSSSNLAVVQVASTGRITAMSAGTATVRAVAADGSGVSASCAVKVISNGSDKPIIDPGKDPEADSDLVMFDSCDNLDFFTGNAKHRTGVTVEKLGRMEGSGYIQRISGTDAEIFIFSRGNQVIDSGVSDVSKGQLVFWFYIEDAAKLRKTAAAGGRIEISHSNNPSQALAWDSKEYIADKCIDGWNYIVLPFSRGKYLDEANPFNPKGANYFRIYFNGAAASTEMTYGIDAIGFKIGN